MHEPILDALRRGAPDEALAAAREWAQSRPGDAQAQRWLAAASHAVGDRESSIAAIERAIGLAPDNADLHVERAGLLMEGSDLTAAQDALAKGVGLDPNQLRGYLQQARIAMLGGELERARSLLATASRITPDHPHLLLLQGLLALRSADPDRAMSLLGTAVSRAPSDPALREALAAAYQVKGHHAFAEEIYRGLLATAPAPEPIRLALATAQRRQGRPADALETIQPLLDATEPPRGLRRLAGELALESGNAELARDLLQQEFDFDPTDPASIYALVAAWAAMQAIDDARSTLDAALVLHSDSMDLWRARLGIEAFDSLEARDVAERWMAAMPDAVPALEANATLAHRAGESGRADQLAKRIVELQPGNPRAEQRAIDALVREGDHAAAIARATFLLENSTAPDAKPRLRQILGHLHHGAGNWSEAAGFWAQVQAEAAGMLIAAPAMQPIPDHLPPPPDSHSRTGAPAMMWGPPGSQVERFGRFLGAARLAVLGDRFGATPPSDALQRNEHMHGDQGFAPGDLDAWRTGVAARAGSDAAVIDWLPWWNPRLVVALRSHPVASGIIFVVRDPRDMLLDWLAWGSASQLAMPTPLEGARWLAAASAHIADASDGDIYPHRLIRLDIEEEQPETMVEALAQAFDLPAIAPEGGSQPEPRFASGAWRSYAEALAEPLAELHAVAQRLGYPSA